MYDLLMPVDRSLARTAAVFGYVGSGIKAMARLFFYAPLFVLGGASYLSAFDAKQLEAVAYLLIRINAQGTQIALIFFGVSTVMTGYLMFRATFLPRVLGVLSLIGGAGWLAFVYPPLGNTLFLPIALFALFGCAVTIGWLLFRGVDEKKWYEMAAAPSGHRSGVRRLATHRLPAVGRLLETPSPPLPFSLRRFGPGGELRALRPEHRARAVDHGDILEPSPQRVIELLPELALEQLAVVRDHRLLASRQPTRVDAEVPAKIVVDGARTYHCPVERGDAALRDGCEVRDLDVAMDQRLREVGPCLMNDPRRTTKHLRRACRHSCERGVPPEPQPFAERGRHERERRGIVEHSREYELRRR